jgi:hypothetical protein
VSVFPPFLFVLQNFSLFDLNHIFVGPLKSKVIAVLAQMYMRGRGEEEGKNYLNVIQ